MEIGFVQWIGQAKYFDVMTWLILGFLAGMFLVAWIIVVIKSVMWREARNDADVCINKLAVASSIADIELIIRQSSQAGIAAYYLADLLRRLYELSGSHGAVRQLSQDEYNQLELMSAQLIDARMYKEQAFVAPMGAFMALSPLLGLFGTVWGLVNSFLGISQYRSADITAVAPGLAQGLMTTAAGLIVAIPSAIFLFLMQMQIRSLENKLITIANQAMWIIHRQLVRKGSV
ncbi:MotA/TolQ/ExbB proton channel family protein [Candidatus Dependentiae bacterium]|nr:MotA/TolQ/ExbB proton channel family protein [Candidatus Dependentiae bacterium]